MFYLFQFAGQSPDDKIKFLFKVYDIDGKLDCFNNIEYALLSIETIRLKRTKCKSFIFANNLHVCYFEAVYNYFFSLLFMTVTKIASFTNA